MNAVENDEGSVTVAIQEVRVVLLLLAPLLPNLDYARPMSSLNNSAIPGNEISLLQQ